MADKKARARMNEHRADMRKRGLVQTSTHIPKDIVDFIDEEKKSRGLASKGYTIAAIVRDYCELKKKEEEMATG